MTFGEALQLLRDGKCVKRESFTKLALAIDTIVDDILAKGMDASCAMCAFNDCESCGDDRCEIGIAMGVLDSYGLITPPSQKKVRN